MQLRVQEGDIHLTNLKTRMPFKCGIATMTRMPMAFVRIALDIDGRTVFGVSADLLPPKWFTKDPNSDVDEEVHEMLAVIARSLEVSVGITGEAPFEIWQELCEAQDIWSETEDVPPLLAHFGTSMIERAIIDAFCRGVGDSFHRLLLSDRLGVSLESIHPALQGKTPADLLPKSPTRTAIARHTVGLADRISAGDIAEDEKIEDGLPQSLDECIRRYGLKHFKIKIGGDLEVDRSRLIDIAKLLRTEVTDDMAFTLDGNEMFPDAGAFRDYWNELNGTPELEGFWVSMIFVEQPIHRSKALDPDTADFTGWADRPPIIIDESDSSTRSLPTALKLGYSGTSHKNCKGVFKGIANACLLEHLRRSNPDQRYLMSGEDLCNVGPVSLLQDLAVCAVLGVESVERNGHHYNAGLSQFPQAIREQIIHSHGDIYQRSEAGWPTLHIQDGRIALATINESPFGVRFLVDPAIFTPAADWRWP